MKKEKSARLLCLFLFIFVMVFFCLLGLAIPIRPKESELEKRQLAEFPQISVEGVLDGGYFSDISTWYSDSFPLRDLWMSGNNAVKNLYGIKTKQIVSGNNSADDIPVVTKEESTSTEEASIEEAATEKTQTETETEVASVEVNTEVETEPASAAPPAAIVLPTDDPSYSLPPISGQKLNGVYIDGDTGYGMYFFNQEAATTYINLINRTAQTFADTANIYMLLVPNSEAYYLTDEQRVQIDPEWKNEKAAIDYYTASFDSNVKNVDVYGALAEHTGEYIYFRTDHHWTGLGAYYAYAAWAQVKGVTPHSLEEYERVEYPGFTGSYYSDTQCAAMEANPDTVIAYKPLTYNRMTFTDTEGTTLDWPIINDVSGYRSTQKYSCFAAGDNPFSYIENPNVTNGEACILVKESYADAFIPYLTDHYQFIYWFDYRNYNGSITDYIKTVTQTPGINNTDIIFVNGVDPISSVESMNRFDSLMQ